MTKMYWQNDVDPTLLPQLNVAIIGYGSQGRAHALNLRDSGARVQVGLREGGKSWKAAQNDGFEPVTPKAAVKGADIVAILVPDLAQPELLSLEILPFAQSNTSLLFAHGFNIHFEFVDVPKHFDVMMVAPKGPGQLVRRQFVEGRGVPSLFAIHQDHSGRAKDRALAYAHGIGGTRAGVIETSFAEETNTDLFGEQAVLCGGVTELVTAGFETLVDAGYAAEVAYFECLHELKLIVDLLYEGGLEKMHETISDTAKYGDLTRGPRVVDENVRARMKTILSEIESGQFAREWQAEYQAGGNHYDELMQKDLAHPIEDVGRSLRSQMSWLKQPQAAHT